jgi:hypothetical protein
MKNSDEAKNQISFRTSRKDYYKTLLTEMTQKRFKSYETRNEGSTTVATFYKSTMYPKIIITVRTIKLTKDDSSWNKYDFTLLSL